MDRNENENLNTTLIENEKKIKQHMKKKIQIYNKF